MTTIAYREPVRSGSRIDTPFLWDPPPWPLCPACGHLDRRDIGQVFDCLTCQGVGYLGVPTDAASARQHAPGSPARVAIYTARNLAQYEGIAVSGWDKEPVSGGQVEIEDEGGDE